MITKRDYISGFIILALVTYILLFKGCGSTTEISSTKETTTDVVVKEKIDSIINNRLSKLQPQIEKQPIYIYKDRVVEVPKYFERPVDSVSGDTLGEVKQVNKVIDKAVLDNGTVESEILTDGNIYSIKYKLNTRDSIITNTIKETQVVAKSGLFGEVGTTFGLDGRIKDIEVGINYLHKSKWYIGSGLQYDLDPLINLPADKRLGVKIKIGLSF